MRPIVIGTLLGLCSLTAALPAAAQPTTTELLYQPSSPGIFSDLEIVLGFGVIDRGVTGVGEPLLGYGYDHSGGPRADMALRLFFAESNQFVRHGIALRGGCDAGQTFGLAGGYGFATTTIDLAYVLRFHCPCISGDDTKWFLSAVVGVSMLHAEASTGAGARGGPDWNDREAAASKFDHDSLGAVLGVTMDLHLDVVIVGASIDLREHFSMTDGPIGRSFETGASVHAGFDLDL